MPDVAIIVADDIREASRMPIHVQFWGQAKRATGRTSLVVELPGSPTVAQVLSRLAEDPGHWSASLLPVPGREAHPEVVLFVDGQVVDLETTLASGAVLNVMPPIAGG